MHGGGEWGSMGREYYRKRSVTLIMLVYSVHDNGPLTLNHSPLGRAGLIKVAKKMAVTASRGHAIIMRTP